MDTMIWRLHLLSNEFLHVRQVFNMLPQAFSKQETFMTLARKHVHLTPGKREPYNALDQLCVCQGRGRNIKKLKNYREAEFWSCSGFFLEKSSLLKFLKSSPPLLLSLFVNRFNMLWRNLSYEREKFMKSNTSEVHYQLC